MLFIARYALSAPIRAIILDCLLSFYLHTLTGILPDQSMLCYQVCVKGITYAHA